MAEIPIYLDPCLYIPQGATPQERAQSKARIIADLQAHADEINQDGNCRAVVGVPPWMKPTAAWLETSA